MATSATSAPNRPIHTTTVTVVETVTVTVYPSAVNTPVPSASTSMSPNINISSSSSSSSRPMVTQNPSVKSPVDGEKCDDHGQMRCGGLSSFAQCHFGKWLFRSCNAGTVCKEDGNSIYCGFP